MKKRVILFLLTVSILVGTAAAGPTWEIRDPGSTHQRWDFYGDNAISAPDILPYNPYATEPILATVSSDSSLTWADGVWSGYDITFTTTIPNTDNTAPDSYKDIVIEIGYKGTISLAAVTAGGIGYGSWMYEAETYEIAGETWNIGRYYYHIEPNPTSEDLCIALSTFDGSELQQLDYVMVDTICAVPVPGAIFLGGLGVGLVGWMRRKKAM